MNQPTNNQIDVDKDMLKKLVDDWYAARKESETKAQFEQELTDWVDSQILQAKISEVDDLRREFWRTSWSPYDPDSIFIDRLNALKSNIGSNDV